ncbi:MAG: hypothetical protein ACOC4H_03645, partial [bacterium]
MFRKWGFLAVIMSIFVLMFAFKLAAQDDFDLPPPPGGDMDFASDDDLPPPPMDDVFGEDGDDLPPPP